MRERPILFSGPMVRAILDGTKTQTRRVVGLDTLQPSTTSGYDWTFRGKAPVRSIAQQKRAAGGCWQDLTAGQFLALCPHGQPGDRLWVRETFSPFVDSSIPARIDAASYVVLADGTQVYRDGAVVPGLAEYAPGAADHIRWRPSIHMPRWASRLTLEVTSVRVERLQDITEDDARAEGVDWSRPELYGERWDDDDREDPREVGYPPAGASFARDNFRRLWSSINGPVSWAANPWVWVVGFKRVEVRHG